jgi:hypothetical protein
MTIPESAESTERSDETPLATPLKYGERTLRRIRHARTTRDTILAIAGVVFAIVGFAVPTPADTFNDAIGFEGVIVAVYFGFAALIRGVFMPLGWDRTWGRGTRYGFSVFFLLLGLYGIGFSLQQTGHLGPVGYGVTSHCEYQPGRSRHSGGENVCDLPITWSDGTTTNEGLDTPYTVHNGQRIEYTKGLFIFGAVPVAGWPQVAFYLFVGVAIVLQSLFSLTVLIFGRGPR